MDAKAIYTHTSLQVLLSTFQHELENAVGFNLPMYTNVER